MEFFLQCILEDGLGLREAVFVGDDDAVGIGAAALRDPQCRGVGHKDHVIVAAFLLGGVGDLGFQHADDGVLVRADLEGLPHRIAAVGRSVEVGPHDADLLVVGQIHIVDAAPLGHCIPQHGKIRLADTLDRGVAVGVGAHLHRAVQAAGGRNAAEEVGPGFHDVVHILCRDRAAAITHDLDTEDVGAHIGKTVLDALGHTVAKADDDDHGHFSDDDAQHGQKGTEFVAPDVLERLPEGLVDHTPSSPLVFCAGVFPFQFGWTTASGAWASPS